MDSLELFVPVPRKITVAGTEFTILPLAMKQIPPFAKAIGPVIDLIANQQYLQAAMDHADAVEEAVAIATGVSKSVLDEMLANEFLVLAGAVFEVNLDFFAHQVLPAWTTTMTRLTAAMAPAGAQSSPGSPEEGTASPPVLI